MSDLRSPRLSLPLLAAGQAQKEMIVNEALTAIDISVGGHALSADLSTPPSDPEPGQCWIVADDAVGPWAGRDGHVAGWTAGGWRFVDPPRGMRLWVEDRAVYARHDGSAWQFGLLAGSSLLLGGVEILNSAWASIPAPTGGTTIDAEARAVLVEVISALQHHRLSL